MVEVDTLIFDVDDTLYGVSTGFSDHRNHDVMVRYMVEQMGFATSEQALEVRNQAFSRFHSSTKGMKVFSEEGRFPDGVKAFDAEECMQYWADNCEFSKYLSPDTTFIEILRTLRDGPGLKFVAFSNSPHAYAANCLEVLGLREFFPDTHIFGVDDVLPACKPEAEAFDKVLRAVGSVAERSVMFEDSIKNVRAVKALGMHTVLIDEGAGEGIGGEAALLGDIPVPDDPAVDVVMQRVGQLREALPSLWEGKFAPTRQVAPAA